jgi:O-glycosyl hydrolase
MAEKQNEIPVILKLYDLTLWTMQHTAKFPRHHRYSLGTKIEATLLNI